LGRAAEGLRKAAEDHGSRAVGVLGSGRCTNEANFLAAKLARAALGTNSLDFSGRIAWVAASSGVRELADSGSGERRLATLSDLGEADLVLLCDGDLAEQACQVAALILERVEGGPQRRFEIHNPKVSAQLYSDDFDRARLVAVSARTTRMGKVADISLQSSWGKEAVWIKGMVRAVLEIMGSGSEHPLASEVETYTGDFVKEETGIAAESLLQAARAFASASHPVIVYSSGLTRQFHGAEAAVWLSKLALLKPEAKVFVATEECNTLGACDAGVMPHALAGGALAERGLAAWDMPEKVKAMLVVGDDPIARLPDSAATRRALDKLDFLVVQDSFLTETAKLADVVLPAALFAEEDGTFTSAEGRVQRVRKASEPPDQAKPHWQIICELASAMGYKMAYSSPEEVMKEIAAASPLYAGATYDRLAPFGTMLTGDGSTLLPSTGSGPEHVEGTIPSRPREGRALGASSSPHSGSGSEEGEGRTDEGYPFLLFVDGSSYPWQGNALVENAPTLAREYEIPMKNFPGGFVEINPDDLQKLGLRRGARVKVVSRLGEMQLQVAPNPQLRPGTLLLPFFLRERAAGVVRLDASEGYPAFAPCPVRIERSA